MAEPRKIRVLYFDELHSSTAAFIGKCGSNKIIDLAGCFGSFADIVPSLETDGFTVFRALFPDVIVFRADKATADYEKWLPAIRQSCPVKLVGLLPGECEKNRAFTHLFDYCTFLPAAGSYLTDDDAYSQLLYQIKTARLALNIEKNGIKGEWAILPLPVRTQKVRKINIIAMGASTGGTEALSKILQALPANLPPIIAVQHMPDNFTQFFADNLVNKVPMKVKVAAGGELLEDGTVYFAGNAKHLEITRDDNGAYYTKCTGGEKVSGHRPSVDVLFRSVAKAAGNGALGVILTGMGNDGAQGLLEMRESGAYTIGQNEASCVVYGMPMVAQTIGAVIKQVPLDEIPREMLRVVSEKAETE